jgi:type IX secretion system PorP/SprF family membrane protein
MTNIKKYLVLAFVVMSSTIMMGQDIHFSQFYMSPLNLNPAMTGLLNCKTRLIVNYRNQWSQALTSDAYSTYSVSYDQKVAVGRSDYFGIGGTFWGDTAGELNYGTTQGRLSFSYSKKMGGYRQSAKYLVFGADAGITQRRVDLRGARWPSQHDGNGNFDATLQGSSQDISDPNFIHADLSAGLLFFNVMDANTNYYIGLALHHLNQSNVSFVQGSTDNLTSRLTFHGGGQFEINKDFSILPGFIYLSQGQHREINAGASARFNLGSRTDGQSWQLGAWYRIGNQVSGSIHSDAFILSTRFDYGNYGIGFSYDITVSQLREAASFNGAFEFALNYLICGPEKRAVYCPRF